MQDKGRIFIAALGLLLGLWNFGCWAEEPDAEPAADAPSMALLEFLGEWETPEGEWIDPTELAPWSPDMDLQEEENDETH